MVWLKALPYSSPSPSYLFHFPSAREAKAGSKGLTNIIKCKCRGFRAISARISQFTNIPTLFHPRRAFTAGLIRLSIRFSLSRRMLSWN